MHRPSSAAPARPRVALSAWPVLLLLVVLSSGAARAQDDEPPVGPEPPPGVLTNDVLTIVAFGANATANHGADLVYPLRLAELLEARDIPAEVVNAGAPGDTTTRARARFSWDVLAHRPDVVVIEFGFNDAIIDMRDGGRSPQVSLKEFVSNLDAMLDTLDEKQIPAILMTATPLLWNDETREQFGRPPYNVQDRLGINLLSETYVAHVRNLARRRNVRLIDLYTDFLEYDAGDDTQLDDLLHEGHHPGDEGHLRIARHVAQQIADMIAEGQIAARPRPQADLPPGQTVFVSEGRREGVHDPYDAWESIDGVLWGTERELLADASVLPGDFVLRAEIILDGLADTAAAFRMGTSYFGFDGSGSSLYVSGRLFDDRITQLRPASELIVPGEPVLFVVERVGDQMRFLVDGQLIHAKGHAGPLEPIGFSPANARLGIKSFSIRGRVRPRPEPLSIVQRLTTVDLAEETERQVVVDRDDELFLGQTTTLLLDDGQTILCAYPEGFGRGALRLKRSGDGGRTWSGPLDVPANWASSQAAPTLHKVKTPRGSSRLLLFSGLYPIRMASSENEGETWTPLRAIGDFGGIVAMSSVFQRDDGTIVALFYDDGRFLRNAGRWLSMNVYKTESTDGGETWSQPNVIAHRPDVHLCEPALVRSPDGQRLAVLLQENSRTRNSFIVFSDDEGRTWTEPRELPASLTGARHVAREAKDGRLVVTFRDTALISATFGEWVVWVGSWDDLEQGQEGQYRVRLMDNVDGTECAYAGLEVLTDGTFVATTFGRWTEGLPPYVVSVRFTIEELDACLAEPLTLDDEG